MFIHIPICSSMFIFLVDDVHQIVHANLSGTMSFHLVPFPVQAVSREGVVAMVG